MSNNPTIAALKTIKDELAKIDSDINLQGGIKSVVIKDLVKALSVAVEHIRDINHGFSKSGLRYGGIQYEQISAKALTTTANILSGKDGE